MKMKCDNCGFENEDNTTSCIVCGFSLIKEEKNSIEDNIQQNTSNKDINGDNLNIDQQTDENINQNNPEGYQENNQNQNVGEFVENENNFMNSDDDYFEEFNEMEDNPLKYDKENDFPSDKDDFFTTRNVVIICSLIILLTLMSCICAIIVFA